MSKQRCVGFFHSKGYVSPLGISMIQEEEFCIAIILEQKYLTVQEKT